MDDGQKQRLRRVVRHYKTATPATRDAASARPRRARNGKRGPPLPHPFIIHGFRHLSTHFPADFDDDDKRQHAGQKF
ncbi:hypothetical protein J8I87_37390 [Paraburkholderia sp. LEh10]|uniref:hypothetical protein n=1 Tax=Paraburkholderia sp. LEh10 TaxID=2821353 RepID=UPI001AEB5163|nr:hypothetical protein [Paraburkholderia sp. LEh10]MBP0595236.1 hypothetical protein [Paraburkholderia sp. LEh10]